MPQNERERRYPMRGLMVMGVHWDEEIGWQIHSMSAAGVAASSATYPEWNCGRGSNIYAYTSMDALRREADSFHFALDWVDLQDNDDDTGYLVTSVRSRAMALITVPPDGKVTTLNWETFYAPEARLRNVAKLEDRIATAPLRDLLGASTVGMTVWGRGTPPHPSKPILNLHEFDIPPMQKLADEWNFRVRPVELLEVTPEPTTPVSRAPGWLKQYAFTPLSFDRKRELAEDLAGVLNHARDPRLVDWIFTQIEKDYSLLQMPAVRGTKDLPMTYRELIRQNLREISTPALRQRVALMVDPSVQFDALEA